MYCTTEPPSAIDDLPDEPLIRIARISGWIACVAGASSVVLWTILFPWRSPSGKIGELSFLASAVLGIGIAPLVGVIAVITGAIGRGRLPGQPSLQRSRRHASTAILLGLAGILLSIVTIAAVALIAYAASVVPDGD